MNNENLTLVGLESTAVSITRTAAERRDELLARVKAAPDVTNQETATLAADLLRELKGFSRVIEASRADVKAPVLDLAKRIDEMARTLTADVDALARVIGSNLAAWQAEQNRIAERLKREAWEREEAIRREAEAKERAAQEKVRQEAEVARRREEEARRQAEAAQAREQAAKLALQRAEEQAAAAKTKKQREAAEAARMAANAAETSAREAQEKAANEQRQAEMAEHERQQRLESEARAREEQTTNAIVAARVEVAQAAPAKQAGIATQMEVKFEVEDIVALYEAQPAFVLLSPNNAAIKAALKNLRNDQKIPGVRHWREAKSIVR